MISFYLKSNTSNKKKDVFFGQKKGRINKRREF
jgi:hypothetical protein